MSEVPPADGRQRVRSVAAAGRRGRLMTERLAYSCRWPRLITPAVVPGAPTVMPPLPWTPSVPLKTGLFVIVMALQGVPPLPEVMTSPPPLRLPEPEAHVSVVLPCTDVFAVAP